MKTYKKRDFPVHQVRRFLEPGPIVLVSSKYRQEHNIMAMGWHMVLEFSPSLLACLISPANHSYDLITKSKECVINLPTAEMLDTIVHIGNSSGTEIDKFSEYGLTPIKATKIKAPLIKECFANFECRVQDVTMKPDYGIVVLKVVKAHVAMSPKYPQTVHYRGEGIFMISGKNVSRKSLFLPELLN